MPEFQRFGSCDSSEMANQMRTRKKRTRKWTAYLIRIRRLLNAETIDFASSLPRDSNKQS